MVEPAREMVDVRGDDQAASSHLASDDVGVEPLALAHPPHGAGDLAAAREVHLGDLWHSALRWSKQNASRALRGSREKRPDLEVTPYAGLNRVRFEGSDLSPPERAPLSLKPM